MFSGDYAIALSIAIFFELFWLDLLPVGTFIPPHLTLVTFSTLSLVTLFDLNLPGKVMIVILLCMPLAWLGAWMEGRLRQGQNRAYNKLLNWSRKPDNPTVPAQLILRSVGYTFIASLFIFLMCMAAYVQIMPALIKISQDLLHYHNVTWPHMWIAASVGGVMALRVQRAYAVLIAGIVLILAIAFVERFSLVGWL